MTNMTKDEIKALQIKAAEISDHLKNARRFMCDRDRKFYEANRENHDDAFVTSCIANDYWWKFEWYLKGSDLWKDSDFDDIDEIAAEFEGWFAGFCQKKSAN